MISSSGTSSKPSSVSMPFRYLIGCPLGSWIMRKAIAPSLEVAGNILTGTSNSERRRLHDKTGMRSMGDTLKCYLLPESGATYASRKSTKMDREKEQAP